MCILSVIFSFAEKNSGQRRTLFYNMDRAGCGAGEILAELCMQHYTAKLRSCKEAEDK